MRLRRFLGALLCVAVCGACAKDEAASPLEQCRSEAIGECCEDDECAVDSLCDFDYLCSPAPGGGVTCSEPDGDRMCHSICDESQDGIACRGGGTCTMYSRAAGGDSLMELWVCL